MIHIVFNESEVDLMKEVIALDESLAGEVVQVKDDYAVGPLTEIHTEEGWQARQSWWMSLLQNSPYAGSNQVKIDDRATVNGLIEKLAADPQEQLWIWMGQNQHDVMGYYWLIPQLSEWAGRVMVLYLNNLPFINEKGQLFYPSWLSEILPKEFIKAKKLARPISLGEYEVDGDEWKKLAEENAMVRILEGGKKIISKPAEFYDTEILKNLNTEWQKATRVLMNTLHRMKIKTGDVFLMWRVKQLIAEGKIAVLGDVNKGWKEFDIKLPGSEVRMEMSNEIKNEG